MNLKRIYKGNAMIYALVVVMILSIILTTILNISDYERRVTKSHRDFSNLYDMAVSGVENALILFNKELDENIGEIFDLAIAEFNTFDIASLVEHVNTDVNVYGGDFLFKDTETSFADTLAKSANYVIAEKFYSTGSFHFEFSIEVTGIGSYNISVDAVSSDNAHNITSIAYMEETGASATVNAVIAITGDDCGFEAIVPRFGWINPPGWAYNVINPFMPDYSFSEWVLPYPIMWEEQNPLLVTSGAGITIMDVGMFYGSYSPIPSVIISRGDGLTLTASDPYRNEYSGVIYSTGDVTIEGVNLTGSIISSRDIIISSSGAISPSTQMLFEPAFTDETLRRRVYDFFQATAFHEGGNIYTAAITGANGFVIENMNAIRYFIKSLVRVY